MSIKEIFCQDKAINRLQSALAADKVAHAYIFAGPEGVGKFKTALEWSKLLLCKNKIKSDSSPLFDSCSACESCKAFDFGLHPDFNHIYKELINFGKDSKTKRTPIDLPIDVVREFLLDKVSLRPRLSNCSVYVISETEKLNTASQNALLKVLEEPPVHCFIIMLCTRTEKLLPTIRSRCQTIPFGSIDENIIIRQLAPMGLDEKQACYWARFCSHSLGTAIKWASLATAGPDCIAVKKNLVTRLATYQPADTLDFVNWMLEQAKKIAAELVKSAPNTSTSDINRQALKGLLMMIIAALDDVMKLATGLQNQLINCDQQEEIRTLAGKFTAEQAAEGIENSYRAIEWLEDNVNERLILERLLLNPAASPII